MQPMAALMKVITFPARGADPTIIRRTLPPTFCLTNQKTKESQMESFLMIHVYSSSVFLDRAKLKICLNQFVLFAVATQES